MTYSIKLLLLIVLSGIFSSCGQSTSKTKKTPPAAALSQKELSGYSQATFSSGCFWCVEAVFESVKGVKEAISGYAGGSEPNPTYELVGSGSTGHAETVNVYYDSAEVSFPTLLKVYFGSEDPVQVDGQGPDHGRQYRSIIFYRNDEEKNLANDYIQQLNASGKYSSPIAATVEPFTRFWEAEDYHQSYVVNNPDVPYVRMESIPRIKRFQAEYPDLIKPDHKF